MDSLAQEEPTIIVNGRVLTQAQAMTVRVALASFAALLADDDALGSSGQTNALVDLYRTHLAQVQILIYPYL